VPGHTGVKVTNGGSLLSRFIEITYRQQNFLVLIPIKLRVYEGIRGYERVYEGIRGYTSVCEVMLCFLITHCSLKAYCAIWVRRSNFRHQASPRVSPRESTQRRKVEL